MPRLVATGLSRYASRDLKPGEEFDATESDAFVLKSIGKAENAKPVQTAPKVAKNSEDVAAAAAASEMFAGDQQPRGSRYNRRDMRSKD